MSSNWADAACRHCPMRNRCVLPPSRDWPDCAPQTNSNCPVGALRRWPIRSSCGRTPRDGRQAFAWKRPILTPIVVSLHCPMQSRCGCRANSTALDLLPALSKMQQRGACKPQRRVKTCGRAGRRRLSSWALSRKPISEIARSMRGTTPRT